MIRQAMFVIAVPNLNKSEKFYRDVLGFEIREIGDSGWRMYARDGIQVMAGECPEATAPIDLGDHSYYAYFVVSNAQAYYDEVKSRGAEIRKNIRDEPWGMREFAIRTADGHRIMLGQDI